MADQTRLAINTTGDNAPRFVKVDGFKPCIFCEKPTCYLAKPTNERSHRHCWNEAWAQAQQPSNNGSDRPPS